MKKVGKIPTDDKGMTRVNVWVLDGVVPNSTFNHTRAQHLHMTIFFTSEFNSLNNTKTLYLNLIVTPMEAIFTIYMQWLEPVDQ